ncbi:prepilin-type N-terminal cleavage/methylation domain-containing protein [Candidatus Falkowbacteria bacterium]|nr:prepilin-type N-terminal cleavage/methylation domain-containing protein [Candidatus Falkowbacteria bacterium]
MNKRNRTQGFTLLELLIVIAIIAILSVILVLVLNPAETLKKSRDAQRISDLNTLKTALGLIVTASTSPNLSSGNTSCSGGGTTKIFYSNNPGTCATTPTLGSDSASTTLASGWCSGTTTASIDGNGWLPVNFGWLPGGSPISNLPLDPTNTIAAPNTPVATDLVYRYTCQSAGGVKPSYVFELNAALESAAYTVDDDKRAKDGGDNTAMYEVGTDLRLLPPTGQAF